MSNGARNRIQSYHLQQYDEMYRSTAALIDFIEEHGDDEHRSVIDIGCGAGANVHWLSEEYPSWEFHGVDTDDELVSIATERNQNNPQVSFRKVDFYDLKEVYGSDTFDYVLSSQFITSSVIGLTEFLDTSLSLARRGVFCHELFSEGWIEQRTKAMNLSDGWEGRYDVYSLERLDEELHERCPDATFTYEEFHIDIDLPEPDQPIFKTYTVRTADGDRLQISGNMLMRWYHVFVEMS